MALKLGILISGRGSNMVALAEACEAEDYPASVALVLSNRADAAGIERAREMGLATAVIPSRDFDDRESHEAEVTRALKQAGVDLVCLAGYMRILTPGFVETWRDRMINIHPSLLPALKGLNTHERALDMGLRISGCTVHYVRADMDDGPILVQAAVPVMPGDDADALAARVREAEHRIYLQAVRMIAGGQTRVAGVRVLLNGSPEAGQPLLSPLPEA